MKEHAGQNISNREYVTRTYDEMLTELRYHLPHAARAEQLIELLYNRLTLIEHRSHKEAIVRMKKDLLGQKGFSARTIYRHLPHDNPLVPHRKKIPKPKGPKILDIVVTSNAMIDPENPNIIIDDDKIIIVKNKYEWEAEKIIEKHSKLCAEIFARYDAGIAFIFGRHCEKLLKTLPKNKRPEAITYDEYKSTEKELRELSYQETLRKLSARRSITQGPLT